MSVLDKLAGLFALGRLGEIRTGRPRLLRAPLGEAILGGGAALLLLMIGLASLCWLGRPGHWVERALLAWLGADYLRASWRLRPQPEDDYWLAGGLVDAPWRWNDDGNTICICG